MAGNSSALLQMVIKVVPLKPTARWNSHMAWGRTSCSGTCTFVVIWRSLRKLWFFSALTWSLGYFDFGLCSCASTSCLWCWCRETPLPAEVLSNWPNATQVSYLFCCHSKVKLEHSGKGLDLPQLMQKVSHRQGELHLQPPAQDVRGKAHSSSMHHPQGLPVSHAVVISGTTKSEYQTPSLETLPSPHIPKRLKLAPSPDFQETSGGTEVSPVASSVS